MKYIYLIPVALALFLALGASSVVDATSEGNVTVSADVEGWIDVTFNYNAVSFGTITVGTTDQAASGNSAGAYNVTVNASSDYYVQAYGSDFTSDGDSFSISNLKMDTDTAPGNLAVGNAVALSTSAQTIDTGISYTVTTHYHGFWITIPSGTPPGTYSTTVTITYNLV